jgi:glycosyltransferase involved in cell wall biosynthesis
MWGNAWLPSLGKRIICSINHTHDQVPSYYFPWYKRFARRNAVYFALNKTIQRDLEKFHIQRDKIVWQPIGIDEVFFFQVGDLAEVKRKYKIEDTDKIILRVARLEKDKKHELFFDAMTTIVRNVPDVKLFVAGEGAQRSALEQYISQRQLNGKVIICGECRNDLPALNRIARLAFALGWGSAMTESMFCGLPMISFNEVGADEIISDGVNGRIVPVNDTDALARCAIELLNDDTARSAMGEAGRKYVQNRFTYKKVVEAYERFYEFPEYDPHVPGNMV